MAVIVDFTVPGASADQMYALEALTQTRGEALGRPPFDGCMFLAVTAVGDGFRLVSAWRTEAHFRTVMDTMLGPDLAAVGAAAADIAVAPAMSMAIPGTHGG